MVLLLLVDLRCAGDAPRGARYAEAFTRFAGLARGRGGECGGVAAPAAAGMLVAVDLAQNAAVVRRGGSGAADDALGFARGGRGELEVAIGGEGVHGDVGGGGGAGGAGGVVVLKVPLAELALVQVQPVLLGPDYHAGSHEPHECNDLVGGEAVSIYQVRPDQAPRAAQAGFAVHGDVLLVHRDGAVGEVDKPADEAERGAGAVVEIHVEMGDAEVGEVLRRVEFLV